MGLAASDAIQVSCACGARLRVPASAAGRKAKCPKCAAIVVIPQSEPVAAPAPAPSAEDWLDTLAGTEPPAARSAVPVGPAIMAVRSCPQCGVSADGTAVLCTACGYNFRTHKQTRMAATGPSVMGAAAAKAAKAGGKFALGCVLSTMAAVIGAGIWYLIAMKTGYEVGYIAWGIGGITGFGMALGSRMHGGLTGAVASVIAFSSIVLAKVLIFFTVIGAIATGDTDNRQIQEVYVAAHIAAADLQSRGIDPNHARSSDERAAESRARQQVRKMSDAELTVEWQRCQAQDEAKAAQKEEKTEEAAAPPRANAPAHVAAAPVEAHAADSKDDISISQLFFKTMFGFLNVVFLVFAMVTAYGVAARGT